MPVNILIRLVEWLVCNWAERSCAVPIWRVYACTYPGAHRADRIAVVYRKAKWNKTRILSSLMAVHTELDEIFDQVSFGITDDDWCLINSNVDGIPLEIVFVTDTRFDSKFLGMQWLFPWRSNKNAYLVYSA